MAHVWRIRLLDDPKPLVVGISWVVMCAEYRRKEDESPYLVDIQNINIANVNKVS